MGNFGGIRSCARWTPHSARQIVERRSRNYRRRIERFRTIGQQENRRVVAPERPAQRRLKAAKLFRTTISRKRVPRIQRSITKSAAEVSVRFTGAGFRGYINPRHAALVKFC